MASYDYDDLYEDDYDEGLSAEDQEQLDLATTEVKDVLAASHRDVKVTTKQIQDSLWHYYYDVDKTVAYLVKNHKPKPKTNAAAAKPKKEAKKVEGIKKQAQPSAAIADEKGITGDVKELSLDDVPLPKSKNLDVLKEYEKATGKKHISFVVAGHVDHGKSTMMGRLLLDLKVIDERTISNYRKEATAIGKSSFALAWVMDDDPVEREHGVTIDVASYQFETEKTFFTILDAPGHSDFVVNMIAGASQADFAVLVVDASTGAFESGLRGQTKEHALILRSLGIPNILVAVNKMDAAKWSKDRFDEISQQATGFLTATGFKREAITFIPVSGLQGDNIVSRSSAPEASWYTGPTVIEKFESYESNIANLLPKPMRMGVHSLAKTRLSPTTVIGRIEAGSLQVGDALLVQPTGQKAYVSRIEIDHVARDWVVAGQHVWLFLSHLDPEHIRVGDVICHAKDPIGLLDNFFLKALAFEWFPPTVCDFVRGRTHVKAEMTLAAKLDKHTGAVVKKKPKFAETGDLVRVDIRLPDDKVPLEKGQRVVIRDADGKTLCAGLVELKVVKKT